MLLLVLVYRWPPVVVKGVLPLCWLCLCLLRMFLAVVTGELDIGNWVYYVAVVMGCWTGTELGVQFGATVNPLIFTLVVFWLLVLASLAMVGGSLVAMLVVSAVAVLSIFAARRWLHLA